MKNMWNLISIVGAGIAAYAMFFISVRFLGGIFSGFSSLGEWGIPVLYGIGIFVGLVSFFLVYSMARGMRR